ncbi:MAG: tetratricopeptide repeat protein [Lachnospiraceae bacterium]|nr:tetratricopeptide repeat protein [Lachnospiraceae bacterium]
MNCLHCGAPVLINDVCSECGLKQEYLIKAWNTSLYYYNQGLKDAKIRNLTGAEEALKLSLRYYKANIDARNLLGLVYYETGQVVEALAQWVISSNYQPQENPALRYLKIVQGNQNKLNAYDQAAKKYNLTLHYVRQKNHDLALIQLKRVLSENPHFVKAYLVLALVYMQNGNADKAKKALQRALKIDKFNPLAQHYLTDLQKNERQYTSGVVAEPIYEDDWANEKAVEELDAPEDEEELDSEETARRKIREIIERGAAAEDINSEQNLEVGSYKEIKYGKHNVLYLIAGLTIGIAAMFFLIMPARVKRITNENQELKSAYSAELSGKNVMIASLQDSNAQLEADITALRQQMEAEAAANGGNSINDSVMTGVQAYMNGSKQDALVALGTIDLTRSDLSEATKSCIRTIVNGCPDEMAAYRSNGLTAYGAENYQEAINQLQIFCNLNPDDVEARFSLAKSYENVGNVEASNALYQDINTRFPDSEYVTTMYQ